MNQEKQFIATQVSKSDIRHESLSFYIPFKVYQNQRASWAVHAESNILIILPHIILRKVLLLSWEREQRFLWNKMKKIS